MKYDLAKLKESIDFTLKRVSKIPKYATKESFVTTQTYGDDDKLVFNNVHLIVRKYKKYPNRVFVYGYYKESK